MHQTRDTYSLSHFRQRTGEHLERIHQWREAIRAYRAGERGVPAGDALRSLADEVGAEP